MATPVGHSLLGLAFGRLGARRAWWRSWRWYLFALFSANAADLDFVPGLIAGDANLYHHLGTHSLGAALAYGLLCTAVASRLTARPVLVGVLSTVMYASHVVADWLTVDGRAPYGIPLFWPLDPEFYIAPFTPFEGVRHGVPGDGLTTVLVEVFSPHNLSVIALELLLVLPVFALIWLLGRGGVGRPARRPRRF